MNGSYDSQRGALKLFSLLPFTHSSQPSMSSIPTFTNYSDPKLQPSIYPEIRETNYGETLAYRSQIKDIGSSNNEFSVGPPDLVHWARYSGVRSSLYTNNDFVGEDTTKDDDGYIGFYHYVNGLGSSNFIKEVENYIFQIVGIYSENDQYFFTKETVSSTKYTTSKRDIVVTYCSYNLFTKSDFRVRYVIHMNGSTKKIPIQIDKSYQTISYSSERKNMNYNSNSLKEIPSSYWIELKASQIIRLFKHLDYPSQQITGLVSYSNFVDSKVSLIASIQLLIKFLSRGYVTGTKTGYGASTSCGTKGDILPGTSGNNYKKTNSFRNNLVDTILRLCQLDLSGESCQVAINEIKKYYFPGDWNWVILQIYKVTPGFNKEQDFLNLVRDHLRNHELYTTQLGLILLEQAKFLISKQQNQLAVTIAQKCVSVLPLDFECWYSLTLAYCLNSDYENAILTINSMPVIINNRDRSLEVDIVANIKDFYLSTFLKRSRNTNEEVVSEKTFYNYFPNPKTSVENQKKSTQVEEGSIKKLWTDLLLFNPNLRHPISGNHWYQSPVMNCSARELSSVDSSLIKTFTSSAKMMYSRHSSGSPSTSVLDMGKTSTWDRCYDLLASIVAMIGWENVLEIKSKIFSNDSTQVEDPIVVNHERASLIHCENWLDQLFVVLYEDLETMINMTNGEVRQHSSAEWGLIGLLGWCVKYNLRESITSLMTSVMGASSQGGFDYFGTVQILEIYNEFILSEVSDTNIDLLNDSYDSRFFSNKFTLRQSGHSEKFLASLGNDYMTTEFILLQLIKLISWNVRWYQYTPNYIIVRTLSKLIAKYDLVYIRTSLKVIFEQNKKNSKTKKKFKIGSLLKTTNKVKSEEKYEFVDEDTIIDYVERIICWIDNLRTSYK